MSGSRPSIAVLGPGGVGGLVAGALARAGEAVTVVARDATAELIAQHGLQVDSASLGHFRTRPAAVGQLDRAVDVLVVATKSSGLAAALKRVSASPSLVLPLLNGVEHLAPLRLRFGAGSGSPGATHVLAGTIRVEAQRVATGVIAHTSPSVRIEMASTDPAARPAMWALADTLTRAGLPALVLDSEAQVMWTKLVRLNALACTTSAFDVALGPIRSTPRLREALVGAVREGAAIARAEGADVSAESILAELDGAHATLTSSMARDIAAGNEPELDAIAGAVMRAAGRHGLSCPAIAGLVALIEQRRRSLPRN